ncbi:hypothetical protein [Rhodococcus sp. B10]|uniref:hypothetical protein n=1 Tax=Rhodococcus sp. B10 TaxID=2695876 RepID=UPI00143082EC|nr:hypothetical protein [Rhodococcus sp. B10]NIL77671.1 hypothetical protein [Rhodococcus sp. B10]
MSVTFYDRSAEVIDQATWQARVKDASYVVLSDDRVPSPDGEFRVYTLWQGVDFSLGKEPVPQIFQTIVERAGRAAAERVVYAATEAAALTAHAEVVDQLRAGLVPA